MDPPFVAQCPACRRIGTAHDALLGKSWSLCSGCGKALLKASRFPPCPLCKAEYVLGFSDGWFHCSDCKSTLPIPLDCPSCKKRLRLKSHGLAGKMIRCPNADCGAKIVVPQAHPSLLDKSTLLAALAGKHGFNAEQSAVAELRNIREPWVIEALVSALEQGGWFKDVQMMAALESFGWEPAAPPMKAKYAVVRKDIDAAVAAGEAGVSGILDLIRDGVGMYLGHAAEALIRLGKVDQAVSALGAAINAPHRSQRNGDRRRKAVEVLVRVVKARRDPAVLEGARRALRECAESEEYELNEMAYDALRNLGWKPKTPGERLHLAYVKRTLADDVRNGTVPIPELLDRLRAITEPGRLDRHRTGHYGEHDTLLELILKVSHKHSDPLFVGPLVARIQTCSKGRLPLAHDALRRLLLGSISDVSADDLRAVMGLKDKETWSESVPDTEEVDGFPMALTTSHMEDRVLDFGGVKELAKRELARRGVS